MLVVHPIHKVHYHCSTHSVYECVRRVRHYSLAKVCSLVESNMSSFSRERADSSTESLHKLLEEVEILDTGKSQAQSNKTVLLTGGAGFIGSHTAQVLLKRGDRVIIVDEMNDYYDVRLKMINLNLLRDEFGSSMSPDNDNLPLLSIYRGDICDVDFISNLFEKERPTHICHLAARACVRLDTQET